MPAGKNSSYAYYSDIKLNINNFISEVYYNADNKSKLISLKLTFSLNYMVNAGYVKIDGVEVSPSEGSKYEYDLTSRVKESIDGSVKIRLEPATADGLAFFYGKGVNGPCVEVVYEDFDDREITYK